MAKHIGIVAVSPEGSALCYRQIARHAMHIEDPEKRPLVTLHNLPFSTYVEAYRAGDWEQVAQMMIWSAKTLYAAGANFLICPDNIAHHALTLAEASTDIPWLNMIELVTDAVCANDCTTLGLIGTQMIMHSSTYQTYLGMRGVTLLVPYDDEVEQIDRIIFTELIEGRVEEASRQVMLEVMRNLAERGCEGVVLASTETPLLVTPEQSPLPSYDPVRLLAEHAVRYALQD